MHINISVQTLGHSESIQAYEWFKMILIIVLNLIPGQGLGMSLRLLGAKMSSSLLIHQTL